MSIIFGKYHIKKQPLFKVDLIKMRDRLNHWEADDTGLWKNEYVGLGHLMLWNTPESLHEKLPLKSFYSGNIITADARIDNREELYLKLKITDQTVPDSTLILAAYDKYGKDCIFHLIGDFVFAIWDVNKEELFCARDQMGVKPFFYYYDGEMFIWASEMKGLLCLNEVSQKKSKEYINSALKGISVESNLTVYDKIKMLSPASYMNISLTKFATYKYWDLKPKEEIKLKDEEYINQLHYLFNLSIKDRLRTAFPSGCQLSGGLDSVSIAKYANIFLKERNQKLIAFTHSSGKGVLNDEYDLAQQAASSIGIENLKIVVSTSSSYFDFLARKNKLLDGPFVRSTASMSIDLADSTKNMGLRTMLSGFLGDVCTTYRGGPHIREAMFNREYLRLWNLMGEGGSLRKSKRLIKSSYNYFFQKNNYFNHSVIKGDLNTNHIQSMPMLHLYNSISDWQSTMFSLPGVNRRIYSESIILNSSKVEMKFPMIDIRLLEFSLNVPSKYKVQNGMDRFLFRKMMHSKIPENIRLGSKQFIYNAPATLEIFIKDKDRIIDFMLEKQLDKYDIDYNFIVKKIKELNLDNKKVNNLEGLILAHFPLLLIFENNSLDIK